MCLLGHKIHQPWCFFPCPSGFILQAVRGDRQTLLFSATFPERLRQADSHPVEDGRMLDYQPAEVLNWSDFICSSSFFPNFFVGRLGVYSQNALPTSCTCIVNTSFGDLASNLFQWLPQNRGTETPRQLTDGWRFRRRWWSGSSGSPKSPRSFSKCKMTDGLWCRIDNHFLQVDEIQ